MQLFHYTRADVALINILPAMKIRAGLLKNTNDPRETADWGFPTTYLPPFTPEEELSQLESAGKANLEANRIRTEEWGLMSFSYDKLDDQQQTNPIASINYIPGFAMPRLWAHYGGNHTGVCLEFDGPELVREIQAAITQNGELFLGPMKYGYEITSWPSPEGLAYQFDYHEISSPDLRSGLRQHIKKYYKEYFLHKTSDWESEREYRMLIHSTVGPFYFDIKKSLRHVFIGPLFCERINAALTLVVYAIAGSCDTDSVVE